MARNSASGGTALTTAYATMFQAGNDDDGYPAKQFVFEPDGDIYVRITETNKPGTEEIFIASGKSRPISGISRGGTGTIIKVEAKSVTGTPSLFYYEDIH